MHEFLHGCVLARDWLSVHFRFCHDNFDCQTPAFVPPGPYFATPKGDHLLVPGPLGN